MRSARIAGLLVLVALLGAGLGRAQTSDSPVQLKGVAVERAADGAAVTVKTSGPATYEAKVIDSPIRLVIDLQGATFASPRSRWASSVEPIKEVRGSQWKKGIARVVVELTRQAAYRIDETPDGLVVVLDSAPTGRVPAARVEAAKRSDVASDAPKAETKAEAMEAKSAVEAAASSTPTTPPALSSEAAVAAARPAPELPAAPPPTVKSETAEVVAQATAPVIAQAQQAPSAPAPGPRKLISLDFKDADIINLLRILAAESGKNIVAGDDVKGRVSVSLKNVTPEQALDTILEVRGLEKVVKDGVIRVVTIEQLTKEREAQARVEEARRKAEIETRTKMAEAQLKETELATKRLAAEAAASEAQARGPLKEEVIRLLYADPEEVAKTLQGILGIQPGGMAPLTGPSVIPAGPPPIAEPPFSALYGPPQPRPSPVVSVSQDVLAKGITITPNKATNSIFVRLYAADLERIKKLIREDLDVPLPQVKIEARMEILDRSSLEAIGIQWGGAFATNAGSTTLVGQGLQTAVSPTGVLPVTGGLITPTGSAVPVLGTGVSGVTPANPNLSLSNLLPVSSTLGLPLGGNLVNLPFQGLPNSAALAPAGGIAFGIIGTNFNVNLALQALANMGKTRTLAHPEVVTVENAKAAFTLGEDIPYATVSSAGTQVQFKEAVLKLEVTPTVIREKLDGKEIRKVKMVVVVENNSRGQNLTPSPGVSVPIINKRKAETQVLVKEGDRLVIGGVTQNVQQNTVNKVPLFGDIPVIGWLFKQKENFETGRELVVFVTPSVLRVDGAAPAAAAATPAKQ